MVNNNESRASDLLQKHQSFKITTVPEENVENSAAFISGILCHLKSSSQVQVGIDDMLLDIFLTSTIWKFSSHLETLWNNHMLLGIQIFSRK